MTHYHWKHCTAGCGVKTTEGYNRCHEVVCLDPTYQNSYHENLHVGRENPPRVLRSRCNEGNSAETQWDSSLGSDMVATNITSV
eukprot:7376163-Ditylum_brightwellii.AAC.1